MNVNIPSIELLDDFFNHIKNQGFSLPKFVDSEEIIIISDYSGERKEDKHYSYSFYIVDRKSLNNATWEILQLRENEVAWNNKSFIEFKKLSQDKVRQRILPNFLNIFDKYEGLVITILVDKKSPDYFLKVNHKVTKQMEAIGFGTWKEHILRKSSNILSIMAFLAKTFLDKKKSLTWYSDRDDIFGGDQSQKKETLDMFCQFLKVFKVEMKGNTVQYVSDKHTLLNSDFLSIADLSAGAVLDVYQTPKGGAIKDWKQQIMGWMHLNSTNLKKLMIVGTEDGVNKQLIAIKNY